MEKSNIFIDSETIKCRVCGRDLMADVNASLVNIVENTQTGKIVSIHPCCKGRCDDVISKTAKRGELSGWKDLSDFTNPFLYLQHVMSVMNSMFEGVGFENQESFEEYKKLLIQMYPYVARNMSDKEIQDAKNEIAFLF